MCMLSRLTETHGTFVVVVVAHQSIHRFRGASVTYLLQFPRWFPTAAWYRSPPPAVLTGRS